VHHPSQQHREARLAFLIPTLTGGGAERVLVNLLKMVPAFERHLVLLEKEIAYDYDAELHVLGAALGDAVTKHAPPGFLQRAARIGVAGEHLARLSLLKRRLPGTWVSFTTWANVLNVLAPGEGPVVVTSHNHESTNISGRAGPFIRGLVRLTYPRADAVVAVSNAVKADLVERFGVPESRVVTIYNTVDIAEARALASESLEAPLSRLADSPCIVTAGSLKAQKGHWHLLRAFAEVKRRVPGARLLVMGDGPLRDYLTSLSRALRLSTYAAWEPPGTSAGPESADVLFLGFRRNPFAVLARATLFAFPSLWEGFGNVLVEAMACGTPVVSADCPSGPREILAPERTDGGASAPEYASAGVLMPRFDGERRPAEAPSSAAEHTWAEALSGLLNSPDDRARYARAGRTRAEAFTLEAIAPAWQRLFAALG
jgi:glycosyltransferase involved in cell wall biosynthesis